MLAGAMLVGVLSPTLTSYGAGLSSSLKSKRQSAAQAAEDAEVMDWLIAHTKPADVLVCYHDPKYYLFTGRKATPSFAMREGISWENAREGSNSLPQLILRMIHEARGNNLVYTASDFSLGPSPELHRKEFKRFLLENPGIFVPVWESRDGQARV